MGDLNDKKIEILQVSEKLFAERGFEGTSVRDIAAAANINVAMISYYFGSKEKMLEAMVLHRIGVLTFQLENLYQEDISPIEKVNQLVAFYIKRIYANKDIYMILHFELSVRKRQFNTEAFSKVKKQNMILLENIIAEGQEQRLFQSNINIALIQPMIVGSLIHILISKSFYMEIFNCKNESEFETYIHTIFTTHIQKTVRLLLTHEN